MAFQKGKTANPNGRAGKGEVPTRDQVLTFLWRVVKRNKPLPATVQGCKALLEALAPPLPAVQVIGRETIPAPAKPEAKPAEVVVPAAPAPRPSLGERLSS